MSGTSQRVIDAPVSSFLIRLPYGKGPSCASGGPGDPAVYSHPRRHLSPETVNLLTRARALQIVLSLAAAVHAQAPVITSKGDPSIANDSIYLLARQAAKSTRGYVILLDDGVIRVGSGGRGTRTYRTVVLVNDLTSALQWRGGGVRYDPTYAHVRLNWARVVREDGTVVSSEPDVTKDDMRPADDDRGYDHNASMGWRLKGVEPGTIVDFSYTEEIDSTPTGLEVPLIWRVGQPGVLVRRSRLILDASDSLRVFIVERNLKFKRRESVVGGRRVYSWTTSEVTVPAAEPFTPDSATGVPLVRFHTDSSWIVLGEWYAQRSLAHLALGKLSQKRYSEITSSEFTHADTVSAIYRYAVQGVNSLGTPPSYTGYWPWAPDKTVEVYSGDSQDKSALLVAMLRRAGVDAAFVLAVREGTSATDEPSPELLLGALVRVVEGEDTIFVDPGSRWLPPGVLPDNLTGALAIAIRAPGDVSVIRLPRPAPGARAEAHNSMSGEMDETGAIKWRHTVKLKGTAQDYARRSFHLVGDSTSASRASTLRLFAQWDLPSGVGSDLKVFEASNLHAAAEYSFTVSAPALQSVGQHTLLPLLFADLTRYVAAADHLEHHLPRVTPIDIGKLVGDQTVTYDVRLTLPVGWKAILPPDVRSSGEFGTVVRTYAQDGRTLRLMQEMIGAQGTLAAERAPALIAWLRFVTAYRAPYIVIAHGAP